MLEEEDPSAVDEVYSYATLPSSPAASCRNNIFNFKARMLGFYRRQVSSNEEKAFQQEHRNLLNKQTDDDDAELAKKWCGQSASPGSICSEYSSHVVTGDHFAVKEEDIDKLLHGYTPSPQSLRRLTQRHADMKTTAACHKSCLKNNVAHKHQVQPTRKNVSIQEANRHGSGPGIKQTSHRSDGVRKTTSVQINEHYTSCINTDIYEMIHDVVERKENGPSHRLSSCSSESPSPSLKTALKKTTQRHDSWDSGSASSVSIEMQPFVQHTPPRLLDLNVAQKDMAASHHQHHYNIYNPTRSVTFRPTVNSKM